jgi:hypothetical protein
MNLLVCSEEADEEADEEEDYEGDERDSSWTSDPSCFMEEDENNGEDDKEGS